MNPSINPQQLQQAISWAKSNPTDPKAIELQSRIQSGAYNDSLKTLGYDTSKFVPPPAPVAPESTTHKVLSTVGNFAKNIVAAPATIVARPIQAAAELAGASADQVDKATSKLTGGIVAPVPQNGADVKKDVGRGIETVALGTGSPLAGGAAFGVGSSLEQGNDLFSGQTAFQAVLGAGAGKVLGLIGEPIMNAAGKAIGKITPEFLSNIASQGTKAIEDFAAAHEIPFAKQATEAATAVSDKVGAVSGDIKDKAVSMVKGSPEAAAAKTQSGVTDLIRQNGDTMTPSMKKEAIAEGRQTIKSTKLGGTEYDYTPTKEVTRAAEILSDPKQVATPITSKDAPNVVYAKTQSAISTKGAQAEKFLADNPVSISPEEHTSIFKAMTEKANETSTETEMNAYKEQLGLFEKQLKGGNTTSDYYKALKSYEDNVASKMAKGKDALLDPTGVASAKVQAAADIRSTVRDFIGSKHPEFQPQMYDLASLYEARDNALFNASKGKSQSFMDKHPNVKTAVKAALGGAGVVEAVRGVATGHL